MVRGLLGNMHQGCHIFSPFSGMQCTAMALIALLTFFSRGHLNRPEFSPQEVDSILFQGNRFYGELSENLGMIRYLSHVDLPSTVTFNNRNFRLQFLHDVYYGVIDRNVNTLVGQTSFFEAIEQSSRLTPYHLLTIDQLTVALYLSPMSSSFYVFDSHERDIAVHFSL